MAASCDRLIAYGDDATIESIRNNAAMIGFGSRVSGAVVGPTAMVPERIDAVAEALARDVALFEQPHDELVPRIFMAWRNLGHSDKFRMRQFRAMIHTFPSRRECHVCGRGCR